MRIQDGSERWSQLFACHFNAAHSIQSHWNIFKTNSLNISHKFLSLFLLTSKTKPKGKSDGKIFIHETNHLNRAWSKKSHWKSKIKKKSYLTFQLSTFPNTLWFIFEKKWKFLKLLFHKALECYHRTKS